MDADMAADPDERRFDEGISLIKAGKIEEAIEIFSELVEKDATNHKAWNAYGVALSQTIHTESAIHCFENALQLDPGNKIYERNLKRVKSPPPKKVPRKMAELTPHKKSRKWIGGLCILFIFIGLCALLFSGVVPGFSVSDKNLGLFPQPTPTPEIIISTPTPVSTATTPPPTPSPTPVPTPPPKPETLFHFIDVGQGDAALIQSQGKNMLIDAGPKSAGQRLVEYLKRHNVTTLDYVVASHPYEDHIGGMLDVIRAFTVKNYVDNGLSDSSDLYTDVINAVISDQAVRMIVTAGMSIPFTNTTTVEVIGPHRLTGHQDTDSLVLRVTMHNVSVIFPGDATDIRGPATILKLPGHGSDSAIGSIMNTRPQAVIISLGSGNPYGYPRSATLDAIKRQGSRIYRTDVNGTIVIRTDGKHWTAQTAR